MDDEDKVPQSRSVKRKKDSSNEKKPKVSRQHPVEQQTVYDDFNVEDGYKAVIGGENIHYKIKKGIAFDEQVQTHIITLCPTKQSNITVRGIFDLVRGDFQRILQNGLCVSNKPIKVSLEIKGCTEFEAFTNVKTTNVLNPYDNIEDWFVARREEMQETFNKCYGSFEKNEFYDLWINFNVHNVKNTKIPFKHKGICNIRCPSYESFKWSVLSGLHPTIEANVNNLQMYSDEINMDDVNIPVHLYDISKIEKRNDISINVFTMTYSYDIGKNRISGPVYCTENRRQKHINLLYYLEHNSGNFRYYCIQDLREAVDETNDKPICDGCLNFFETNEKLERHKDEDCLQIETIIKNNKIKYNNNDHETEHPIIVYADFEALLSPVNNNEQHPNGNYTCNISQHIPVGYAYFVKCRYDNNSSILNSYIGRSSVDNFLTSLVKDLERLLTNYYKSSKHLKLEFIPIFFHNFKNYDAHFIIDKIGNFGESNSVEVLGDLYHYIAIYKKIEIGGNKTTLRFLDSIKFLKESLDTLASNLDSLRFREIHRLCHNDDLGFTLLCKKGVLPYDYIQSFDDLLKTSLPEITKFRNRLTDSEISDDDYKRALQVWEHFQCKNIGDYLNLYVKTDVLLLADVFENLRRFCLSSYHLDPAYYYSISSLSWDAMLRCTEIELEPFTDLDMLLFINNSIRGGVAHCSKRHAVANNKYLDNYEKNNKESYIMYYDANNLYAYAMCQYLPYGGFEWVDTKDVKVKDFYEVPSDSPVGYILEVDLSYPNNLHDDHADFPFCPEKKAVPGSGHSELSITDLTSKRKYVIHYSHLSLCVQQGLRVDAVHRILKFKQKPWLQPYIRLNTTHRMTAVTESDKNLFKLMNNSIFGKTLINVQKYTKIKISQSFTEGWKSSTANLLKEPDYKTHAVCSESMIAVERLKPLVFKEPRYVGFCILELAKTYMYNFHYNIMTGQCFKRDKVRLLYTDTDSLIYQIYTHDYYNDIKDYLKDYFDTENYGKDNLLKFPQLNKKELGFFKDEMEGAVVKEFVGLKPKMYAVEAQNGKPIKKATGVPRHITDRFTIDDYRKCLESNQASTIEYYCIQSTGHTLYTQKRRKAGLTPTYKHRCILENKVNTLPWGHCILTGNQNQNESGKNN